MCPSDNFLSPELNIDLKFLFGSTRANEVRRIEHNYYKRQRTSDLLQSKRNFICMQIKSECNLKFASNYTQRLKLIHLAAFENVLPIYQQFFSGSNQFNRILSENGKPNKIYRVKNNSYKNATNLEINYFHDILIV